jgi:predicted transcriptional regulator
MARPSIGDRELALLHHLDECGGASVGEAAATFGEATGLARSTVLTMMERLRAKGYLKRRRVAGVYRYRTSTNPGSTVRHAVGCFVENALGGSVSPFVAWMAERGEVSAEELAELKALVAQLDDEHGGA